MVALYVFSVQGGTTQTSLTEEFRGAGLGLNEMRGSGAGMRGAWLGCCDVADFGYGVVVQWVMGVFH